jgi:uncharacterized protein with ParB-like and HNH nuclease domain
MNLFEDTTSKPPKQFLGEIDAGEAALPDFQRDFAWEPSTIKELLASVDFNYPRFQLPCRGPTPESQYPSTLCLPISC